MVIIAVPPRTMQFCEEGDNSNGGFVHHYESASAAHKYKYRKCEYSYYFTIFYNLLKKSNHLNIKIDNEKVFFLHLQ